MSDGAHQGVGAKRALETILGDAPSPSEDEGRTPHEMRLWLLAAPDPPWDYNANGYEDCARYIGKQVLEAYLADVALVALPMDNEYEWETDDAGRLVGYKRDADGKAIVKVRGLHDVLVERGADITGHGITGFQWGWAVNAARYAVDADQQPNPAIIEL